MKPSNLSFLLISYYKWILHLAQSENSFALTIGGRWSNGPGGFVSFEFICKTKKEKISFLSLHGTPGEGSYFL